MANTTVITGKTIQITGLDADWNFAVEMPAGRQSYRVHSIQFNPSGANDVFRVRNMSGTGATAFFCKCSGDTDQRVKYFQEESGVRPFIKISECTFANPANASVVMILF